MGYALICINNIAVGLLWAAVGLGIATVLFYGVIEQLPLMELRP